MFTKIKNLYKNIKNVFNWYDLYFLQFGIKEEIKIKYKKDYELFINKLDKSYGISGHYYILKLLNSGCLLNNHEALLNNNVKMIFPPNDFSAYCQIYETFFEETYGLLNVKNKIVGDIGASFGDTSVYFAMKGASKVYAYEPLKEVFIFLLENIRVNNLEKKIIPKNIAIHSSMKNIFIRTQKSWLGSSYTKTEADDLGYWVKSNVFNSEIDVLKIDCEGCEYDTVSEKYLKDIDEIILEFHSGSKTIIERLEKLKYDIKILVEWENKSHGLLYAYK